RADVCATALPTARTSGSGSDSGRFQCIESTTPWMSSPTDSLASRTSCASRSLGLSISMPSNPSSFTSANRSATEPSISTIVYFTAFRRAGRPARLDADERTPATAMRVAVPIPPASPIPPTVAFSKKDRLSIGPPGGCSVLAIQHGAARLRHRHLRQLCEHELLREEVHVGRQHLVPRQLEPGVGTLPAQDSRERAIGDLLRFVDGLARADARDQVRMLEHERVLVALGVAEDDLPIVRRNDGSVRMQLGHTLRANDPVRDTVGRPLHLAAFGLDHDTARVLILDAEVVVDVAVGWIHADEAPAHGNGALGQRLHHPIDHIQIVDELLHDMIAGEPREVVPVPTLPFHV